MKWTVIVDPENSAEYNQEWANKILKTGASGVLKVTNAAEQSDDVFLILCQGSIGAYLEMKRLARKYDVMNVMYTKLGWCI